MVDDFAKTVGIAPPALPARERLADPARLEPRPPRRRSATGELGARGCAAFLSEPRFEKLPALFEGPGVAGKAPEMEDVTRMRELRRNGLRSRKRRAKA